MIRRVEDRTRQGRYRRPLEQVERGADKAAGNKAFWPKKKIYFEGDVVAPFALTNELRGLSAWTPKVLEQRQDRLLGIVRRLWHLEGEAPGA